MIRVFAKKEKNDEGCVLNAIWLIQNFAWMQERKGFPS